MRKLLSLTAAALLCFSVSASASGLTDEEAIEILEANNVFWQSIIDDPESRKNEIKIAENRIRKNTRDIARIEAGKVKDVHKLIQNSPGVVSPA